MLIIIWLRSKRIIIIIQNKQKCIGKFFRVIISVTWGVSQRISGFGKKHELSRTVEKRLSSSDGRLSDQNYSPKSVLWPSLEQYSFFCATTQAFCGAHVGLFHNWSSRAYWAVGPACLPQSRSHFSTARRYFSTARRYLQNKIPNLHRAAMGGLNSMSDMWWMGGFKEMWSKFFHKIF